MIRSALILPRALTVAVVLATCLCAGVSGAAEPAPGHAVPATRLKTSAFDIPLDSGTLRVTLAASNVVRLRLVLPGQAPARSVVIDPKFKPARLTGVDSHRTATALTLDTPRLHLRYDLPQHTLSIADVSHHVLLRATNLAALAQGRIAFTRDAGEPTYGVSGYTAFDKNVSAGMLRQGSLQAKAGLQGWAGAPLAWSSAGYGVLAGLNGGRFDLTPTSISISSPGGKPFDVYLIVGEPSTILGAVAQLSGHSQLFPKWAMGFTNSQYGSNQNELLQIVHTYRAKHIPIDNFTLDFDWKAWGRDNYGEFRWNALKFPDGPTGELAKQMHALGMRITGIMKPRIHVDTVEGRYATAHDFWVPDEKDTADYFSHMVMKDIDFDIPAARTWFGDLAMKYGFDQGISGWWNDEADDFPSDTQFMNMERALYDAQRAQTDIRVWSLNRNFYLGAQRYAYGLWSGDITTGFANMADQRARMLSAINVGEMQWGMDAGGFHGHPSDENYARWIEFGAFTPIFRVHGTVGEKRQPWVYGPVAEKAATAAIRLRYSLIPYIYSYEYRRHVSGVGLVRPLLFDWPHDPNVRNDVDSWLFGDYLLASPVVKQGQTEKDIYLPTGPWTDWISGKTYPGGETIHLAIDNKGWGDIPMFIRDGAIIPMQLPMDYVGEKPLTELNVEVFPATRRSAFEYYDDDGSTYAYEHGAFFRQTLATQKHANSVQFDIGPASGTFKPALRFYLLKIHGRAASAASVNGLSLASSSSLEQLRQSGAAGWASGHDRFGTVTYVWLRAGTAAQSVRLGLTP